METKKNPKILVCTVNAWNEKVGDNTFPLLLQDYPQACIACLFIREDAPDSPVCQQYFRISEKKVMRSILHRKEKTGCVVHADNSSAPGEPLKQYASKGRLYYTKLFCREAIWKAGKWKTNELNRFIDGFSPDIVLYEMSRYIHLNNIVMYILKRTGAVGIGCFWDDTFTYKQEKSIGYKALRFFQRRNLKKLARHTAAFFAITPKTKREADAFFDIQCDVLTKPIPHAVAYTPPQYAYPLKMLYTGNVGIGRLEVIKAIVKELSAINADQLKLTLDVYTNTPVSDADREQINTEFSAIHPPVPQSQVLQLQQKADILLFVESLGSDNKIARLSFSTKITDYYAAGKCILAVGNEDLAPMELFVETDSAITAVSEAALSQKLRSLELDRITEYAQKAYSAGQTNHSCEDIKNRFFAKVYGTAQAQPSVR